MDNDIQALRSMIAEAKRIAFLGGAGLSTASGIPDFRSEDGIYRAIREFGHPPETLLSHSFFLKHTAAFYRYYRKYLLYPNALPNQAHTALAKLEWGDAYDAHMAALAAEARAARDGAAVPPAAQPARAEAGAAGAAGRGAAARGPEPQGKLTAIVTQNIDDLHQRAGSRNVLELHGSVYRNRCLHCGAFYSLDALLKKLDASPDGVPRCGCGGVIKPDVVLYGEGLDQAVLSAAIAHISRADLLIIGGTSLMVYPAAALIDYFRGRHVVVINLSDTGRETGADLTIRRSIDEVLSEAVD
ncbi:MAG: NAD-dependent deacylase [Eubacteriales bacterium]|nr:NAD-dependent deacylase [Eubacteriales bacterium]